MLNVKLQGKGMSCLYAFLAKTSNPNWLYSQDKIQATYLRISSHWHWRMHLIQSGTAHQWIPCTEILILTEIEKAVSSCVMSPANGLWKSTTGDTIGTNRFHVGRLREWDFICSKFSYGLSNFQHKLCLLFYMGKIGFSGMYGLYSVLSHVARCMHDVYLHCC